MRGNGYVSTGTHRIILAADRALPPEKASERSTFWVAPLTFAELQYQLSRRNETIKHPDGRIEVIDRLFPRALDVVRAQLRSAENFPADAPMPYPADGTPEARDAYIALLGWENVLELGGAIMDQAFVTDAEKNA